MHTPGPWHYSPYAQDGEELATIKKLGLRPTRLLTNEGQAIVMGPDERVAVVDCHTKFKRGQGHLSECDERDANARLIAAAPDLLATLRYIADDCHDIADAINRAATAIAKIENNAIQTVARNG